MNKLAQKISSQICVKLQGKVYGPADVDKRKVKWNFEKNSNIPCLSYRAKFIDEFTLPTIILYLKVLNLRLV